MMRQMPRYYWVDGTSYFGEDAAVAALRATYRIELDDRAAVCYRDNGTVACAFSESTEPRIYWRLYRAQRAANYSALGIPYE